MLNIQYNKPKIDDIHVDTPECKNMDLIVVYDEDEKQNIIKVVDVWKKNLK